MATRAQIKSWVRTQTMIEIDDLSDDQLNSIVNEGSRDLATRFDWPFLATSTTIDLTQGVEFYALPLDMAKLAAITVPGTPIRLHEASPLNVWDQEGGQPTVGTPTRFFLWGNQIIVRPIPDTDRPVTVYYYRFPNDLNNEGDSPEWAEQFHMVLADFSIMHVWEREEEFAKAKAAADRYLDGVERMARFYLNRAGDTPLVIGQPGGKKSDGLNRASWD